MKNLTVYICFLISFFYYLNINGENVFQIIPQPQHVEYRQGDAWKYYELRHLKLQDGVARPVMPSLLEGLDEIEGRGKTLELQLTQQNVPVADEGYLLVIDKKGAKIHAKTDNGLFYGCQTLQQLLEDSRDFDVPLPCMKVYDYPSIKYRAVHLDTKHHLDNMNYYYRMIDKLAYYKINAVIWELEDKLRYSRHPEIGVENAISKQEMQALSKYAIERHVEISPLVQGLGHASFILKHHWKLRENPNSDWVFCPSNPETYALQFDLYKDALEALPHGRFLHVGGDEISAIGVDERCRATGKSSFELQMDWLQRVTDFAESQGRTVICWDDMPLKYGGVWHYLRKNLTEEEVDVLWKDNKLDEGMHLFPKSCVYMRWQYGDPTTAGHRRVLQWYKDSGLKVMAATAAADGASTFMPRMDSRCHFIKSFNELTAENQLEGILATSWDDGSPHLETVWRGYIGHAEFSWNPKGRSVENFLLAHGQREFGILASLESTAFLKDLEQSFDFFDGALVTSGRRNPAGQSYKFTLLDLPDVRHPGAWSKTYADKLERAKKENIRYHRIVENLQNTYSRAKRNRFTLEIYAQLNELQHYPVQMLLALQAYDKAVSSSEKKECIGKIKQLCHSFTELKWKLESVFGRTRFLRQPDGFVRESNLHGHIAARTLNFNWMYLYEIPMVNKVEKWIETIK